MDAVEPEATSGKFRKLVSLIKLVLRVFSVARRIAIHPTWNKSPVIPLDTCLLPSPTRHKHKPDLQQLTQPGAMQALTNRIHQRLQLQPNSTETQTCTVPVAPGRMAAGDRDDLVPEGVRRILKDSPWTRTSKSLEEVYHGLQSYEAFKDYPPHAQKQLCKVGWYQKLEQGRIVFRQGQKPSSFYLILSGSVRMLAKAIGGYDEVLHVLKSGQCFGDIAISKGELRRFTCVASSLMVEFLVISKSDYTDLSLRQSRLSYQREKHFAFCKTVVVLKHFPLDELQNHSDLCSVKYFKPNAVIVKDSRKCDWVYVIMTGSCRVVKRFINSNEFGRGEQSRKVGLPKVSESGLVAGAKRNPRSLAAKSLTKEDHVGENAGDYQVQGHKIRHSVSNLQQHDARPPMPNCVRKQFLVQLQILHPKDTFGLSSILHSQEPSIALVSNGADVVMISKVFLLGRMSEVLKVKLQRKVMQYPSEEAMKKRIRDHNTWKIFKHSMVHQVKSRQVH